MGFVLANNVRVATATTGTGSLALGAAATGYQTFAQGGISDGDTTRYRISEGGEWEIGTGTYSATGPTLARSVEESSNSGALLNLSGAASVEIVAAAADLTGYSQGSYDAVFGDADFDCTLNTSVSKISWTRLGERVWLNGEIRLTDIDLVTGNLLLKLLPFDIGNFTRAGAGGVVTWASGLSLAATSGITLRALGNGAEMGFYIEGTAGHSPLTASLITDATRLLFTAEYVTDA